uniref:Family with sequence similarity 151 member B n=1 Tax=Poecilia latipinna TaxID=48699 RepID=A0A3B3TZG7_9TELE
NGLERLTSRFYFTFSRFVCCIIQTEVDISAGTMWDTTLQYFRSRSLLTGSDAVQLKWSHAVNSRNALAQALSPSHMIEADVIMRAHDPMEPIMAHPPDTDSDITLKEWLEKVKMNSKGIKLDFKSLEAVSPSLALLEDLLAEPDRPLWINADVLSGPNGWTAPVDFQAFLSLVSGLPAQTVLSLGWTTGWTVGTNNPGEVSRTLMQKHQTEHSVCCMFMFLNFHVAIITNTHGENVGRLIFVLTEPKYSELRSKSTC